MTHIESSERGITLTKSLAWTVLVGIFGGGLWLGVQIATLSTQIEALTSTVSIQSDRLEAAESRAEALSRRVSLGEANQARSDERYSSILSYLTRIDTRLERIEQRP